MNSGTAFVRLVFYNGEEVYVNPDRVRYVTKDRCCEGVTIISFQGAEIRVKGEPKDVVRKLSEGFAVYVG